MLMDFSVTRVHLTSISRSCTAYCVSIRAIIERHPCTVSIRRQLVRNLSFSLNLIPFPWFNFLSESTPQIFSLDAQPNSSIF